MTSFIKKLWPLRWLFLKIYIFFIVLGLIAHTAISFLWILVITFFYCLVIIFIGIGIAELRMKIKKNR